MIRLVSGCDASGKMLSVSLGEDDKDIARMDYCGDEVTFNGHTIPTGLFRRFLRTSFACLNDHQGTER